MQLICGGHHISSGRSSSSYFERCHFQFDHKHWKVDNINDSSNENDFVGSWEKAYKSLNRHQWSRINEKKTIFNNNVIFEQLLCTKKNKKTSQIYWKVKKEKNAIGKKLTMVSLCGFLSLVYLIVNSSMKCANIYVSVDLRANNFKRERDCFNECVWVQTQRKVICQS